MTFDEDAPASAAVHDLQGSAIEEDNEGEGQDYASVLRLQKSTTSGKKIRRGEKDFESHGTQLQENTLEASRNAMQEVLSYTRVHPPRAHVRGWYFPGRCPVAAPDPDATEGDEKDDGSGYYGRERVVAVESFSGVMAKTTGRAPKGLGKHMPGWDRTWLLPEEALYLVERGDLSIWWPSREIEDIFPVEDKDGGSPDDDESLYEYGTPLSLQAAYSLLIGNGGDQGQLPLEQFQVYSNLRRSGYLVYRAIKTRPIKTSYANQSGQTLWQWLFSLLSTDAQTAKLPVTSTRTSGPLIRPGLYRSYSAMYTQLYLVPRHKPTQFPGNTTEPQPPFTVTFHVYRSRPDFQKSKPGTPDFRIVVIDARTTSVPTLEELSALLDSSPWDPPKPATVASNVGHMYQRLKHGWRSAILAIVDGGLISYLKMTELAFGEERLYEKFDGGPSKAVKGGGRGGKSKRGRRR